MNEVERRVISVIRAVFANKRISAPPIESTTVLDRTLGLESIDFAELVVRLEIEFGADPFSEPNVGSVRTVADLAALYEKYTRPN